MAYQTPDQVEQGVKDLFHEIIMAGLRKERCPITSTCPGGRAKHQYLHKLVHRGWIKVEVYGPNWRVAEVLVGKHAGLRTRELLPFDPNRRPWRVNFKKVRQLERDEQPESINEGRRVAPITLSTPETRKQYGL